MTTDAPSTITGALASLHKPLGDHVDSDTVRATMPAVSYTDIAANNPANPNSPAFSGPRYSD